MMCLANKNKKNMLNTTALNIIVWQLQPCVKFYILDTDTEMIAFHFQRHIKSLIFLQ